MRRTHRSTLVALCCALLFAAHPITTETVVWISGRKDLLATFFGLSSLLLAIRSIERNSLWLYVASGLLFLLALLSKISVAPLALLLPFFLPLNTSLKERYKISIPFIVVAIILGVVAVIGKETVVGSTSILDRLLLSATAIQEILTRILLPMNLSVYYALPSPIVSGTSAVSIFLVACLISGLWFFREKESHIALGIGWFLLLVLLPVLNVSTDFHASGTTFASDRYAYLPLIGILLLMASVATWCIEKFDSAARRSIIAATVVLCAIFVIASRKQTLVWSSAESLYTHAVETEPASVQARVALAAVLSESGNKTQAFKILKEGLNFSNDGKLDLAAATLYAKAGQVTDAEELFQKVRIKEPGAAEPLYGLGVLEEFKGNKEAAEQLFRDAISKEPRYTRARMALADLLLKNDDSPGAENELRKAIVFEEWNVELLAKMSEILAINGNKEESLHLQEKLHLLQSDLP